MHSKKPDAPELPKLEEHVLKQPMKYAGVEKKPGEPVKLRPDQVERYKASGHI